MRLGWVGFHQEGIPALEGLVKQGHRIEAVLTLNPERAARRSGAADYRGACRRLNLSLYEVADINAVDSVCLLKELGLDIVFVIGWTQLLRAETLRTARIGMIGAHASLLPRLRGRAPINWALIRGEVETGNTLFWLTEGVDSGRIIEQTCIPITPYDTCQTLYYRVAESNRDMILHALPGLLRGECNGQRQVETGEDHLPGRKPEDGAIDWSTNNLAVYNFVRALTRPYPGAFTHLDGQRWFIWQAAILPGEIHSSLPGQIIGPIYSPVESACGQVVACGKGAIVLLEIERSDGKVLSGRSLSDCHWADKVFRRE